MKRRRSSMSTMALAFWDLLGLGAGLGLGLAVAWLIWPRPSNYNDLAYTRLVYQQDYALMVSTAYEQDGDLARAQQRLAYLGNASRVRQLVSETAEQAIEQESDLATKRRLARLAAALGADSAVIAAYVSVPVLETPTPTTAAQSLATATPVATVTPRVNETRTPTPIGAKATATLATTATPTHQAEYRLVKAEPSSCGENSQPGYIIVTVRDVLGRGLPGVRLRISWANDQDEFVTGLHPDQDPGYADYAMSAGMSYTITVLESASDVAEKLELFLPAGCATATPQPPESLKPGSWRVVFEKRDQRY